MAQKAPKLRRFPWQRQPNSLKTQETHDVKNRVFFTKIISRLMAEPRSLRTCLPTGRRSEQYFVEQVAGLPAEALAKAGGYYN